MTDTPTAPQGTGTSVTQRILPIASTVVSEATGFAALSEKYDSCNISEPPTTSSDAASTPSSPSQEPEKPDETVIAREDHTEELERGPSRPDRPTQPQKHIGTESGIPTTAGAGTTVSPDDDVKNALRKEQQAKKQDAAVGIDYSDQPCPTSDARRPNPTSQPAEGKTQFESREEQLKGSASNNSSNSNSSSAPTNSATATSTDEQPNPSGGQSVGLKEKLKGNAKVVAGKFTRNREKVEQGKLLKSGAQ